MNEKLVSARARAKELVSKMTLEEKIGQLTQYVPGSGMELAVNPTLDDDGKQVGSFSAVGSFIGGGGYGAEELQSKVVADNAHKIPALLGADVIHGLRTTMAIPLGQSCSWNPEMTKATCAWAAKESRNAGILWTFSPMVDIGRDPRWGRVSEGYGEDPFLCSDFAAAAVRGYQGEGDDFLSSDRILSCLKHYVAYGACIGGRDYNTSDISLQTLHDVYLPSFKAGVEAGSSTVMSAFQDINGVPASGNYYTLTEVLRNQWGFEGFVISDYGSVLELIKHGYAEDERDAVAKGYGAGVDMIMVGNAYNENLPSLVEDGTISVSQIDRSVENILTYKFAMGLFDGAYSAKMDESMFFCDEARELSRRSARESCVLLENNGILPLSPENYKGKTILVTGPVADRADFLLGTWPGWADAGQGLSLLSAIRETFPEANVVYEQGCTIYADGSDRVSRTMDMYEEMRADADEGVMKAAEAAKCADLVIACIGESGFDAGEYNSRSYIGLTGRQNVLMHELEKTGTPIVALYSAGRPRILTEVQKTCDALVCIWQGGTEGAHGVCDVLTGAYNPAGRLTITFPYAVGQLPIYYNHNNMGRPADSEEAIFTGRYNDTRIAPLYSFGYGLSYTTFEYTNLRLSKTEMDACGELEATVTVSNTGNMAGYDVVQLYVRDLVGSCVRPVKELKGYRRIYLEKGESAEITFTLKAPSLAFTDWNMVHKVEPGKFKLWVAHNSDDNALEAEFWVK